jgi:DNA-binding NarL/FixJ family response regulator
VIKVLIVDDQPLLRNALASIIDLEPDIEVVGMAESGSKALQLVQQVLPDVILMDIRMPDGDGIWATEQLANRGLKETKVLILTTFEEDDYIFRALKAGASGFLSKASEGVEISDAIRKVAAGNNLLSPMSIRRLISLVVSNIPNLDSPIFRDRLDGLTQREIEVLRLVGLGRNNDEIAQTLFISPHTVKTHISNLMLKLDIHDRYQLVIEAYETGVVRVGEN